MIQAAGGMLAGGRALVRARVGRVDGRVEGAVLGRAVLWM